MKKTIILSLILFIYAGVFSQSIPQWITGEWIGKGFQPYDKGTWEVVLIAEAQAKTIMVSYPSLNCSGTWKIEKLHRKQCYSYRNN